MRTIMTALLFSFLLAGCDNTKKDNKKIAAIKDSPSGTLTDLTATTDIKKLLCQNWENKEDAEDAAASGGGEGLEIPYRGFSFFEDQTVVENPRDKIRFGKWSMNDADKMISIEVGKGVKTSYKIVAIGPRQMILMTLNDKKQTVYIADAKAQINPEDDPFHGTNNQWRIKPARPETYSDIKLRTEKCVLFYAKFLADNANRGGSVISFTGLPTCFKWYRGGVSVTNKDKVEAKWLDCYYDREQALKGHAMLEKIISKKYKWNKEEKGWVKQSADVVRQMYDTLRLL